MNRSKQIVIGCGLATVVLMLFFPPWVYIYHVQRPYREFKDVYMERPAGYHPIWQTQLTATPEELKAIFSFAEPVPPHFFSMRLDTLRLGIQIAAAILLTGLVLLVISTRAKGSQP